MLARKLRAASGAFGGIKLVGMSGSFTNDYVNQTIPLDSLSGGLDTEPSEGDIVIVGVTNRVATDQTAYAVTSGFTKSIDVFASDSADTNFAVFYKVMGASPNLSFEYGFGSYNIDHNSIVIVLRGVDATTPLDVTPLSNARSNGGTPLVPEITPVTNGCMIVALCAASSGGTLVDFTAPSEMIGMENQGGSFSKAGVCRFSQPVASTFTSRSFGGGDAATTSSNACAVFALRPI